MKHLDCTKQLKDLVSYFFHLRFPSWCLSYAHQNARSIWITRFPCSIEGSCYEKWQNPYSGNMALRGIFRLCVHACMCVCLYVCLWDWIRAFESQGFKFHLSYCKLILFRCSNSLVEVVFGAMEKDYLNCKKRRNRLLLLTFALK